MTAVVLLRMYFLVRYDARATLLSEASFWDQGDWSNKTQMLNGVDTLVSEGAHADLCLDTQRN